MELYKKVGRKVLIILLFLQPLIINPYGWNIYIPLKILLLYSVTTLLFLLKINSILKEKRFEFCNLKALKWLLLIVAGLILSTAFSIHFPSSFFGSYLRFEGLLTWLAYLAIFFFVLDLFDDEDVIKKLIFALSISSIIISIYGIAQFFGYDIIGWGPQVFAVKRAFSSLGNAISLGAYLSLIAPVNIYFFLKTKKPVYIIAASLNTFTLIITFSFGAWSGFLAAMLFLLFIHRTKLNETKFWVGITASVILVVFTLIIFSTPVFKARFSQSIQGRGSVDARILLWKNTLPMFTERPLLGSGPDTFYLAFTKNLSPQYERMVVRNTPTDRAHNEILQILATLGLVGLGFYAGFLISLFTNAAAALKKQDSGFFRILLIASMSGAIGYFVTIQSFFGTVSEAPLYWAVLGLVGISLSKILKTKKKNLALNIKLNGNLIFPACLILMVLPLNYGMRLTLSDYYYRQAKLAFRAKYYNDSFYYFDKAANMTPVNNRYLDEYGKALIKLGVKTKNEVYLKNAAGLLNKLNKDNPKSSYFYLHSGDAYLNYYRIFRKKPLLFKAANKFSKGLEVDPNFSKIRYNLAVTQIYLGNYNEAIANLERILETRVFGNQTYLRLAEAYKKIGKPAKAKFYRTAARQINH